MKSFLCGWVSVALLLGGAVRADYIYTTLDVSGPGVDPIAGTTQAFGINNPGQIVGIYIQRNGNAADTQNGFLFSGGAYNSVAPAPYPLRNWATGINNAGVIVGYNQTAGAEAGFSLNQGTYTTLMVPNALTTQAFGINASGQIVGSYNSTSLATTNGFLLSSGTYTTLTAPGSQSTTAAGINASGQIVGSYTDASGNNHGFLLRGGNYSTIDFPGAFSTEALGINGLGQIVGDYQMIVRGTPGDHFGFLLSNGVYTTIDVPGSRATVAEGINDAGDIVGYYTNFTDATIHGFLATPAATPVPEPASVFLLGIGVLGIVGWARRHRLRAA
jgi:probable HAF family extracellular repeat protein